MDVKRDCKLTEFNRIYREVDKLYHNIAKSNGISDSAFIILYFMRETENVITQRDICGLGAISKQTINSSLKKMEKDGYINLEVMENNHKNKQVVFTKQGEELARQIIDPVFEGENKVFNSMSEDIEQYLTLSKKYLSLLSQEFDKSKGASQEDE